MQISIIQHLQFKTVSDPDRWKLFVQCGVFHGVVVQSKKQHSASWRKKSQ